MCRTVLLWSEGSKILGGWKVHDGESERSMWRSWRSDPQAVAIHQLENRQLYILLGDC